MKVILDTSIIIKWLLPSSDEGDLEFAIQIRNAYANGRCSLYAPSILFYEITNVLNSAIRFKHVSIAKTMEILSIVEDLQIITYDIRENISKTLLIASSLVISIYDASYIQLSDELGIYFFTADKKLYAKAKSKSERIKLLNEFRLEK